MMLSCLKTDTLVKIKVLSSIDDSLNTSAVNEDIQDIHSNHVDAQWTQHDSVMYGSAGCMNMS